MRAGDVVNTGTAAGIFFAEPGGEAIADFDSLGRVYAAFRDPVACMSED